MRLLSGQYRPIFVRQCNMLACARLLSGTSAGGDENEQSGCVAGLVIEPTGKYAYKYRRLGCFRVAGDVGTAWFGLGQGLLLWDITFV